MIRPGRGFGLIPTHDDLTLVLAAWPQAEVAQVKQDLQGNYLREVTVALGGRLDGGRQETRVVGEGVPNRSNVFLKASVFSSRSAGGSEGLSMAARTCHGINGRAIRR